MTKRLTRSAYEKLISENLKWLNDQPNSLEKRHIELIVKRSADHEYGKQRVRRNADFCPMCDSHDCRCGGC